MGKYCPQKGTGSNDSVARQQSVLSSTQVVANEKS